jgi:type I site-specific restriction endonuclease
MANQDVEKSAKAFELLSNRFLSLSVDDFLTQPEVVDKLDSDMENVSKAISKLENKYMDSEESVAEELSSINGKIIAMQNSMYAISSAVDKYKNLLK